jgi:perosamine synthetase
LESYRHPVINRKSIKEVESILESGSLSLFRGSGEFHKGGPRVQALEESFREYFKVKHAVAMNSATSALHAACIACGIETVDDEVIVTPYSFAASATCVLMASGTPVFADVTPDTFCLDPVEIRKKITHLTKAIIPVHLMGHPADMDEIMAIAKEYNLKVIEDSAQALGAKYHGKYAGTIGDCGIFSFNQSKPVSSGEGGMLITNDDFIARVARAVRNHGEVSDPELGIFGYNYRMCEIEASIVLEQFLHLDYMNDWRINLADYLSERLSRILNFIPPIVKKDCKHVYYTYGVKYLGTDRTRIQEELIKQNVYFGGGYVKPLYHLPAFGGTDLNFPVVDRLWKNEIIVTDRLRYPATIKDMDEIADKLEAIVGRVS